MPDEKKSEAPAEEKKDEGQKEDAAAPKSGEQGSNPEPKKDGEKTITMTEAEFNRKMFAARREGKAGKKAGKKAPNLSEKGKFSYEEPAEEDEPSKDDLAQQDAQEFAKVQVGLSHLILDNDHFQAVLKADKTLAKIIKNNPLTLLDSTPVDSEDALSQLEDYLEERASELNPDKDKKEKGSADEPKPAPKPAPTEPDEKKKDEPKTRAQGLSDIEQGFLGRVKQAQKQ